MDLREIPSLEELIERQKIAEFDLNSAIDVDDLISKIEEFDQKFIHDSLQKLFLGKIGDISVYTVNGDYVKKKTDMAFVEAGHWLRYPKFIPDKEIWLDNNLNVTDYAPNLLHEFLESYLMDDFDLEYDNPKSEDESDLNYAHPNANKVEKIYRERHD